MMYSFCRSIVILLGLAAFVNGKAYADTFEFLTYTPPPGWTKAAAKDGTVYNRTSGIGLIYLYNSHAATGGAMDEFAGIWRVRVEPTVPGPAPQSEVRRDGDYEAAVGVRRVDAQGTITSISLVVFVGRGRALGILTMTAGDEAFRESNLFHNSLDIAAGGSAVASPGADSVPAGTIAVDFELPKGYVQERDGRAIVLKPTTLDRTTPCVYGISPVRPSSGELETDARSALLEPLPGWQVKSDHYNAMRGTAGDGWPYYWFRTDVLQLVGASYQYLTAMTMAFPNGPGRVSIVWGFGATGPCTLDDRSFLGLFFSLRPQGWTSDGGKAFGRELQGTWRNSESVGMAQYRFSADGRYEYCVGTSTTFATRETRTGSVTDGRYVLRGSELTLKPRAGGRSAKYRVRIYNEFSAGKWLRTISLLNESSTPPLEVRYMWVEE
jgi:hypothetical protein